MTSLILVIDDSICVRKIVETVLRREGYATLGFADGIAALRWLTSEEAQLPALIFLDLTLPRMDGYTVLRHLRKRPATAQTSVVILSRHGGLLDRLKGRLAGASTYLTKPFHQQAILEAVRTQPAPPDGSNDHCKASMACFQTAVAAPRAALRPITLQRMEVSGW